MRKNGHQPFGLPPENSVCCVAALEHRTTMPARRALQPLFSGGNGSMNNVETASTCSGTIAGLPAASDH